MPNPDNQTDRPKCKLCGAFAASDMPDLADLGLPGIEQFTRDPDICDACLQHDYTSQNSHLTFEQQLSLTLGLFLAVVAAFGIVMYWRGVFPYVLPHVPQLISAFAWFLIVTLVAAVPCITIVWLYVRLMSWNRRIGTRPTSDAQNLADANRFYWLAVWAGLTGHEEYRRRMLKQATATGFADHLNLSDPRLQ
jgi:hypothetical protein